MEHSSSYFLGILAGIIVGIIAVALIKIGKKRREGVYRCVFDERQVAARGKAYKYGFFAVLIYLLLYGLIQDITKIYWGKGFVGSALGICIGVGVYAVVSIWNDAYFSLQENPKQYVLLFALVMVLNLLIGIRQVQENMGDISYGYINLFIGVLLTVILVTMGAKALKDRREQEEE